MATPHGRVPRVMGRGLAQERQTAIAMAHRVDEALVRGSTVLVADIGRPNRKALMDATNQWQKQVFIGIYRA